MKFKNILLSLLLGLTVSGAVTATTETPAQDSMEDSGFSISAETDTTYRGMNICHLSDVDVTNSK